MQGHLAKGLAGRERQRKKKRRGDVEWQKDLQVLRLIQEKHRAKKPQDQEKKQIHKSLMVTPHIENRETMRPGESTDKLPSEERK